MTYIERKNSKFIQIVKHYSKPAETEPVAPVLNYQPVVIDHDRYDREIIRRKVRPFTPQPVAPKVTPLESIGNLIDFNLARLTEAEKRQHAETLYTTIKQLAYCWNRAIDHNLNADGIYFLLESHRWQCAVTGVTHSWKTPLSIQFKVHPFAGGRIALFNIQPRFVRGWLPGEYRWAGKPSLAELAASA